MNSTGYFIYHSEAARVAKSNIFKLFNISHLIEISAEHGYPDTVLTLTGRLSSIDQLIIYSLEDITPVFEQFLGLLKSVSSYNVKLYFILENITLDKSNFETVIKLLQFSKTLKKFTVEKQDKKERFDLLTLYLQENKLSAREIAVATGFSLSYVYAKKREICEKNDAITPQRPILHLNNQG